VSVTGYSDSGNVWLWIADENGKQLKSKRIILPSGGSASTFNTTFHTKNHSQVQIGLLFSNPIVGESFYVDSLRLCRVYEASLTTVCFRTLFSCSATNYSDTILDALANSMHISDTLTSGDLNGNVPVGFIFWGQFIAHELVLNVTNGFVADDKNVVNYRTPVFDLDLVYGQFENNKFMYDSDNKLMYDVANNDLLRNSNGVPIIGDPRNDENFAIAQLQLVFIKFHNHMMDDLAISNPTATADERFTEARRLTTWHFQYAVIHHYLKTIIDPLLVDQIVANGAKLYTNTDFLPTEFGAAVYRLGHAQLVGSFQLNSSETATLHELLGFTGGNRPTNPIDWEYFYQFVGSSTTPGFSKKLKPMLVDSLHVLPPGSPEPPGLPANSLPIRNIRRAQQFQVGSGQCIASTIKKKYPDTLVLTDEQVNNGHSVFTTYPELKSKTPLFYYFLREAEVQQLGLRLGHVGSTIVGETIIEMIRQNHNSYLYNSPTWTPTIPVATTGEFTIMDIITYATAP
jgi:hypothetical protein